MKGLYAVCFTVFSVAILFLILAYFLRFAQLRQERTRSDAG